MRVAIVARAHTEFLTIISSASFRKCTSIVFLTSLTTPANPWLVPRYNSQSLGKTRDYTPSRRSTIVQIIIRSSDFVENGVMLCTDVR